MDAARITELLTPFLGAPVKHITNVDRSGGGLSPEASPEQGGKPPLGLLKEGVALSPAQLQLISTYIDILLRWNARINLTAVRDPEEIVTRHFGESLFAARHLFPAPSVANAVDSVGDAGPGTASRVALEAGERAAQAEGANVDEEGGIGVGRTHDGGATAGGGEFPRGRAALQGRVEGEGGMRALAPDAIRVADIGSGAGFPGIPLKIWAPDIALTLIESNHKKAAFLREITRTLTLTDVNIQIARAETIADAGFDVVTLRAVERFEAILPTASRLVAPSCRLALLISSAQQDQARSTLPDLTWSAPVPVPSSRSRILLLGINHNKWENVNV
jgi:16S rRNA (guanine(527)-N(7))-methyltransferase RsmG